MKERISQDIKKAMKEKAVLRLSTLRMALADFQKKEKEKGEPVKEETGIQIFQSMVRKRIQLLPLPYRTSDSSSIHLAR